MSAVLKDRYFESYLTYLTAIVHSLITHKNNELLGKAARDFEEAMSETIDIKHFSNDDLLLESLGQLTFSLHQLVKSGFQAEVRGMLHHPMEDILNHVLHYLQSLDDVAQNDPMLFIIENEIDAIEELREECMTEYPRDAHALTVLLSHLKDMAMCLHAINH